MSGYINIGKHRNISENIGFIPENEFLQSVVVKISGHIQTKIVSANGSQSVFSGRHAKFPIISDHFRFADIYRLSTDCTKCHYIFNGRNYSLSNEIAAMREALMKIKSFARLPWTERFNFIRSSKCRITYT